MKLALRKAPDSDKWNHKLAAAIIRTRLVTRYPHAGIVIGSTLYHATAAHGVNDEPFVQTDNWELFDISGSDSLAISRYIDEEGKEYDWFSLLAFAMIPARDSRRWYCYELAYYLITGEKPKDRITPEDLLKLCKTCQS